MNPEISHELRSLAAGIRAVALVFVLIVSYFNVRLALAMNHFRSIYNDMLGGKGLPGVTEFVTQNNTLIVLLAFGIPLAAIAVVAAVRNHRYALYSLSGLMVLAFVQMAVVWSALVNPLVSIVNGMRGLR